MKEAIAEMERAVACLAVEVPGEVWEDVRDKWHAALDAMQAEIADLREIASGTDVA